MNATGQTPLIELQRRLALAQQMARNPGESATPAGAALRGLAQILAARNAGKLTAEVEQTEQAQRADSYAKLGAIMDAMNAARQSGQPIPAGLLEQAGQIPDPQIAGLAATLYGRAMEPTQAMDRKFYTDPTGIKRYVDDGSILPGQEGYGDDVLVTPQERLEVERTNANERARANEIARERIGLDRQESERQGRKLSAASEKAMIEAQDAAMAAGRSVYELQAIANDYETLDPAAGMSARWQESIKKVAGTEDAVSVLRARYSTVRNSEAIKNLPPGVATDKDIQLALEGFLPATANPKQVASFLRGLSKMAAVDEAFQSYKARYIDDNNGARGLLDAWKGSDELKQLKSGMTTKAGKETIVVNDVEVEIVE